LSRTLLTAHGQLALPSFLPDATRGGIRALDSSDVERCGVRALVVNTLHLSNHPGTSVINRIGGVHRFMGWNGPVVSDSGGFQVFSLAKESADLVTVSNRGLLYRRQKRDEKKILTPEKCIHQQFDLGSDIVYCLDHCTHPSEPEIQQRTSVEHTIGWARRCKDEFERRLERHSGPVRPLLFAVVQGGPDQAVRRDCAERLLEIGFDGYGYGGWPIDEDGGLEEMVGLVAGLIPAEFPKHALGIGKPENVVKAFQVGYDLFDCVLPTRDGRHGRLYVFDKGWEESCRHGGSFYRFLYIKDECYMTDAQPIDPDCDCLSCERYSRAYVNHLFQCDLSAAHRLATIHNLRFYMRLFSALSAADFPRRYGL
jgi:queuine tRNA-ribosyltransferase